MTIGESWCRRKRPITTKPMATGAGFAVTFDRENKRAPGKLAIYGSAFHEPVAADDSGQGGIEIPVKGVVRDTLQPTR